MKHVNGLLEICHLLVVHGILVISVSMYGDLFYNFVSIFVYGCFFEHICNHFDDIDQGLRDFVC